MKILLLTGNHPRHAYIARKLANAKLLSGLIIEHRENHVLEAPRGIPDKTKTLFDHHFLSREKTEDYFFGNSTFPKVETQHCTMASLNELATSVFIKKLNPDLLLSYGIHKLDKTTLSAAKGECWNIHGGLSPWYKGAITHFWPSYMLEPNMTGMTIHTLSQRLDAGDIIHQTAAPMIEKDGLHDVAARAVISLAQNLELLILKSHDGKIIKQKQHGNGKLWLTTDWKPSHLHLIYDYYNNQIVDGYLNGDFGQSSKNIYSQLNV
ncbi:MAG: folate-dependent phosphoribosylglycinamide formyltransferase PurN [Pseudohongiellaceae bacterium]|jgi:folate-dependent phosphoribosylglycinamide formyltransferase PurN